MRGQRHSRSANHLVKGGLAHALQNRRQCLRWFESITRHHPANGQLTSVDGFARFQMGMTAGYAIGWSIGDAALWGEMVRVRRRTSGETRRRLLAWRAQLGYALGFKTILNGDTLS
jgi:hypothetical protein